jgi:type III secretion protein L
MTTPGSWGDAGEPHGLANTFVVIDRQHLAIADQVVIKRDSYAALVTADELVSTARRQAQQLRAQAEAELEAARTRGHALGSEQARSAFAATVVEAGARIESAYIGLEARIVNTVMDALGRVLGGIDDATRMRSMVRHALAAVEHNKPVRLRVAEQDFDLARRELDALLKDFPRVDCVDLLKDEHAAVGLCVLESEYGRVDASLATQLAAVRLGLVNAFVGRRGAADGSDAP